MNASAAWFADTANFFAFLRSRGWRYALMRQGQYLVALHHAGWPRPANDNAPVAP